jgi:chemotaxis protein histidine kinase CheA
MTSWQSCSACSPRGPRASVLRLRGTLAPARPLNDTSKYLPLFVGEATAHARQLIRDCPTLRAASIEAEHVDELLRHAHSLKGMAAAMGFEEIVALAGATEALLGHVHQAQRRLAPGTADALAESNALLLEMIRARAAGSALSKEPRLIAALNAPGFDPQNPSSPDNS